MEKLQLLELQFKALSHLISTLKSAMVSRNRNEMEKYEYRINKYDTLLKYTYDIGIISQGVYNTLKGSSYNVNLLYLKDTINVIVKDYKTLESILYK